MHYALPVYVRIFLRITHVAWLSSRYIFRQMKMVKMWQILYDFFLKKKKIHPSKIANIFSCLFIKSKRTEKWAIIFWKF